MKPSYDSVRVAAPVPSAFPLSIGSAVNFICDHFDQEIDLEDIAAAAGVSRFYLCRRFNRSFGVTVMGWVWSLRAHLARELMLGCPHLRLTDIAFSCGFNSSAHFSRTFRRTFEVPPSAQLREGARQVTGNLTRGREGNPRDIGVQMARILAYQVLPVLK